MSFKKRILSCIRLLLYPFGCLYGAIVLLRHFFYDHGWLKSRKFPVPVICVGNLSTGGTGKTPMVLYLIRLLKGEGALATLSRGYKRKTKGFLLADNHTGPAELGDEPFLFHRRFPDIQVSVGEDRGKAIDRLLADKAKAPEIIILDDGFQHRSIQPGFTLLLTDYSHRFSKDFYLPAGTLRDSPGRAKKAQAVVVTKCPFDLPQEDKIKITAEFESYGTNSVFFSQIDYDEPKALFSHESIHDLSHCSILLIQGIARPESLREYIRGFDPDFQEISYPDHHDYTPADISEIRLAYGKIHPKPVIILTTEKDAVKLKNLKNELTGLPLYIQPIQNTFLFEEKNQFDGMIKHYVQTYK